MKMHTGAPSASREGPLTWETDISYSDPRTTNSPRPFGDRTVVPKPGSIRAVENILDTPNQDNLKTNPVFPSFSNSYPIYEPYNSQFQNQNVSFPTEGLYNNFLLNSTNAGRSFNNTYDYSEMKDYPNANIYAPLPQMPYRYMDINAMGELADWSFRGHFSTYNGYTNNYIPGNPSEALERNGQYWRYIQSQNHPQQFHMANLQNYQSAFAMRERGIPPPPEDFHYFNSPRRAPINQWAYMNSSNYLPMSLMDGDVEPIAQPLFQQPDSHFRSFASSDQTVQREPLFVDSLNERLLRPCANAESTEYTNQFKNEDKPSQVDFTPQPEVSGPAPVSNNDTKTTPQDEKADETHDKTLSPNSIKAASARRRERMTYNNHQLLTLEYEFKRANFLQREKRFELSVRLGLTERQIKIWFQNRRMKLKRDAAKSLRANAASSPSFSEPHQTLKVIPEDPTEPLPRDHDGKAFQEKQLFGRFLGNTITH